MKKEQSVKRVAATVVILSGVFLLFGQAYGANSINPRPRNNSSNPSRKRPTVTYRRPTASPSSFTPEMSFDEAIKILRNSTVPPLNIAVLWRDLEENADIYRDTPIGMDGLRGVPLRTHLKILLASVSGGSVEKLGYVVDGGIIIIATQSRLPRRMRTRIYDVTDLVSEPANYRFMPGFGMPFGPGAMGFGGGMMSYGGGMMPYGGMGYGGQGSYGGMGYGGQGSYGGMRYGGQGSYGGMSYGGQGSYGGMSSYSGASGGAMMISR
jgi:hypothetical protein